MNCYGFVFYQLNLAARIGLDYFVLKEMFSVHWQLSGLNQMNNDKVDFVVQESVLMRIAALNFC